MGDIPTLGGHVLDLGLQFTNSTAISYLCGLVALDIEFDQVVLHIGDEGSLFGCKHAVPILPPLIVNAPRSDSSIIIGITG